MTWLAGWLLRHEAGVHRVIVLGSLLGLFFLTARRSIAAYGSEFDSGRPEFWLGGLVALLAVGLLNGLLGLLRRITDVV